jgi:methionyl-tRNA formyltransferase
VHRAIVAGDTTTGITIMRVVLQLDAGPMIASQATPIDPDETSVEVEARLATIGAALARDVITRMEQRDAIPLQPQDEMLATYATKLERADSRFDWSTPAIAIHNRIRGLHPWPLAATRLKDRRLLLIRSVVEQQWPTDAEPGTIVAARRDGLFVAASPGVVRITELQPEGRRPMSAGDFLNGASAREGDKFEMV